MWEHYIPDLYRPICRYYIPYHTSKTVPKTVIPNLTVLFSPIPHCSVPWCSFLAPATMFTSTELSSHQQVWQLLLFPSEKSKRSACVVLLIIVNMPSSYSSWWLSVDHSLTAELHSDEVLMAQVLQKDSWRSAGLEVEGDVGGELGLQGGEEEGGGLLVEGRCIPDGLWKKIKRKWMSRLPCRRVIARRNLESDIEGGWVVNNIISQLLRLT